MSAYSAVFLLPALGSLVLAAVVLGRRPRGWNQWSFALGMLAFAAEGVAAYALVTATSTPEERLFWLRVWGTAALAIPLPWGFFVAGLGSPAGARWPAALRLALGVATALAASGALALASSAAFRISDIPGPFYAVQFDWAGQYAVILQVVLTVGLLIGLESCLRTSSGTVRWRIKYLLLGLGGIFLARFFFLSQALLFRVLLASYLTAEAATLLAGVLVIAGSLVRDRFLGGSLTLSRQVLYRSVVASVLGLYLLAVGGLGWLFTYLGIPAETFWGSILIFLSAIVVAALLLSENLRWRLKRFIALNFYRSKYDYREQWIKFTKRLGSLVSLEQLAPQLLAAVTEAAGAAKGVLYLLDQPSEHYRLAGTAEIDRAPASLPSAVSLIAALADTERPLVLGGTSGPADDDVISPELMTLLGRGTVVVPLRWQAALIGVMLIGPERTGTPYTQEDLEFLTTVGEQAAGAIVTAQLSETVAQTREFEAFNRLTSFVIHDLKNSISALSLLSQNALEHFDDPEFQRDAIKTLSRTVERMKALLARLSTSPETARVRFQPVDIAAVALEATRPVGGGARVNLVKELAPVAPVSGDPEALLKVIQNLVTNAVEAVGHEGSITVRTCEEAGWAVCVVTDTGQGMSSDFLRTSLFAPFRSTKKGGWGIGLYQAKGIVEAHGGAIEVTSKEGQGTTFRVKLPIPPAPTEGSRP